MLEVSASPSDGVCCREDGAFDLGPICRRRLPGVDSGIDVVEDGDGVAGVGPTGGCCGGVAPDVGSDHGVDEPVGDASGEHSAVYACACGVGAVTEVLAEGQIHLLGEVELCVSDVAAVWNPLIAGRTVLEPSDDVRDDRSDGGWDEGRCAVEFGSHHCPVGQARSNEGVPVAFTDRHGCCGEEEVVEVVAVGRHSPAHGVGGGHRDFRVHQIPAEDVTFHVLQPHT